MSVLANLFNTEFLVAAVRLATPIALAAMGATICERSGVVNIAMEGIMLVGAFFAAWAAWAAGNPWIGALAGIAAGGLFALLHAWAAIFLHLNHVVSGAVLNILGFGITRYLMVLVYGHPGTSEILPKSLAAYRFAVPGLSRIPVLGVVLFNQTPIIYTSAVLIVVFTLMMKRTKMGLHIHAAGEHPLALESMGVSVRAVRCKAVLISGLVCGLAGAYLSIENGNSFTEGMTSGRGFIALAANTAGGWRVLGSLAASVFFGLVDALALRVQVLDVMDAASELFLIFPYAAALVAVAGIVRKSRAPAAMGADFIIEQRGAVRTGPRRKRSAE